MKTVTVAEMRELDRRATEEFGIPSLLLMENAGRGIAELIFNRFQGKRVAIFSGRGNNGGDGMVVARHLWNKGYEIVLFLLAEPGKLSSDSAINYAIIRKMTIPVQTVSEEASLSHAMKTMERSDVLVDALFGTGLSKSLSGLYETAVRIINLHHAVVAVDVPSGLDSDTGELHGVAVKACLTATLAFPKKGLFIGKGPEHSGKICVVDIGLPRNMVPV